VGGRREGAGPNPFWERGLSVLLFLLTLLSTLTAGALLRGVDHLGLELQPVLGTTVWWPTRLAVGELVEGAAFALPFMAILFLHEWGHRMAAGRHGVRTSPPFLIPFPPHVSVVGTLGGFIRMRSPVPSRRALLDIGLAGPLVSLILSLPILALGILLSAPAEVEARQHLPFLIVFQEIQIRLGEPLLVQGMLKILPVEAGGAALHLHPLAFAGWLGLMLTFLNLLPLARLDGGHILHALHPGRQRWWARATVGIFLAMGFIWPGWWAWAALMFVMGRGRPLPTDSVPAEPAPTGGWRWVAWGVMVSVLLLLPPIPISF
jgi:membrane-associated protease RseP (regulator of RpoE activity)